MIDGWDLCFGFGVLSVVAGAYFTFPPAALIVAGAFLLGLGWLGSRGKSRGKR